MIARRTIMSLPLLTLPLLATGCGERDAPEVYAPPSYSYLTVLRLAVAVVQIDDRTPPVPANPTETAAPLRPSDALKQMAHDRLLPGGSAGRAVFVIDRASLVPVGDGVEGRMSVHLDIYSGNDARVAFAEAQVVRRQTGSDARSRPSLYHLVAKMMDDMNVEFEFQLRRSLQDYLQTTDAADPPPPPVQATDLPPVTLAPPAATVSPSVLRGQILTRPTRP